jgi:hypothetical protein
MIIRLCNLSQIQLALRHPNNTGVTAEWAREFGKTLESAVSVSPGLAQLAQLEWNTQDGGNPCSI